MKNKEQTKGFTLIETLTAIFILSLVIAAGYFAATSGLQALFGARDRTIAFFLAQEGTEFVKNWRDENNLSGVSWNDDFSECEDGCAVDPIALNAVDCSGNNCRLRLDGDGFYRAQGFGLEDTRFERTVFIEITDDHEAEVTTMVRWGPSPSEVISVTEYIYDWRL